MEVLREGRFFKREHEPHRRGLGRVLWRHVRGERQEAPRSYETSYNVQAGYEDAERFEDLKI